MIYLKKFENFSKKITIGIDIDGTINNFTEAYNKLYKNYFPDKDPLEATDWGWYQRMDYNGEDPRKWFKIKKAETFDISLPYDGAVNTINTIYDFVKSYGYTLNIVTNQVTEEAKQKSKIWLDKFGFKYDDIIFVDAAKDKWKFVDIMVDDADKVIGTKPLSKVSIKIIQKWNENTEGDFNIFSIKDLSINIIKLAINKVNNKIVIK